ncbi:MAG: ribonuclease HIII [Limnochordales bacterium]|nr:ribonuclease HIII [Limnochordales bacterium]
MIAQGELAAEAGEYPRVGSDEAGKGDYFGPLVVAAVAVLDREGATRLLQAGVADSKRLSDARCRELAEMIRQEYPCEVVEISPGRYNELYARIGNLNRLLAWAHARALENLLARLPAGSPVAVLVDQFAPAAVLERALFAGARKARVTTLPRGERNVEVAAASVLARATFLAGLERLSQAFGVRLPKGATHVLDQARVIWDMGGETALRQVAKWHFRTTQQLLAAVCATQPELWGKPEE